MEIDQLNISIKDDLSKLPEKERVFFVQMLMVLTDINVFQKLLLYSVHLQKSEVKKAANLQISLNLLFSLAGKLFEGWKLIDVRNIESKTKRKTGVFSDNWCPKLYSSQLTRKGRKSLKFLEEHFEGSDSSIDKISSSLKFIRNKIANHYDTEEIQKYLKATSILEIALYLPKNRGEIFSTANYIFLEGILNKRNKGDIWKAFGDIVDDLLKVSDNFSVLINDYLGIVFDKYIKTKDLNKVKMRDPKSLDNSRLNFFSKR